MRPAIPNMVNMTPNSLFSIDMTINFNEILIKRTFLSIELSQVHSTLCKEHAPEKSVGVWEYESTVDFHYAQDLFSKHN